MRHRSLYVLLLGLLIMLPGLLIMQPGATAAQGDPACPALVDTALQSLDTVCVGLGRNAACYGHNRVDATFWQPREDLIFSQPADRIPLVDLQTVATAPLDLDTQAWGIALLNLQADLPETLPGQAVTMLVMGDTSVSNTVTPEQAAGAVVPVSAVTTTGANIRSRPTTNANVLVSFSAGTDLRLTAQSESRTWYELMLPDGGRGWIYGELVRVSDTDGLAALPVGDRARYGPMQAFYFTTGLAGPQCNEAPNALVISSNELADVTLNVNELEIQLGSTIALTTAWYNNNTERAMVLALLEGRVQTQVGGFPVALNRPGRAIAITLNERGLVDRGSRLIRLRDLTPGQNIGGACAIAAASSAFGGAIGTLGCPPEVTYYIPPPPPTAAPTPVGPNINFVADRTTINPNECVTLAWDVSNIREVYYQNQGVTGQGSRQECPRATTTYTLSVVTTAGEQQSRSITITVAGGYTIEFYADRTNMTYLDCATLFWNTEGIQEVYYQGEGVVGNGSRQECPYTIGTFTYELRVVLTNGQTEYRYVTIDVS